MQELESLLREEFRSDSPVGPSADEVLASVGAAHRRKHWRIAVAGVVAVLVVAAGALLLPTAWRSTAEPAKSPRPPVIAGVDSANADAIINNLESEGMNPNAPVMINALDGYSRFSGCPTGNPAPRCVPYWAITTDGGHTFRALTPENLDLNSLYMFDADHLVLDAFGSEWPAAPAPYGMRAVSSDGGRSWRSVSVTVAGTVGEIPPNGQLVAIPATGNQSAVGVLYPDGSARRLTTVPPGVHIVPQIGVAKGVYMLYLPTTNRVLISVDAGRTWPTRTLPWKDNRTLWVLGEQSGQLYISDELVGPDSDDIYATGDAGVTWHRIAWPVEHNPLASTTRTLVNGAKRKYVFANNSASVVYGVGLCVTDGATLWCRRGTAFVRAPGVRPLLQQGGGLLFTLGGTVDHPVLYSSADAHHWTAVTMLR
jgi:hypothetical protein